MAAVWVLRLIVITMAVTCSLGFVLRRRDWEEDADASLAEALPVLREERRRLEERPPIDGTTSFWGGPEMQEEEEEEGLELEPRLSSDDNREFLDSLLGEDSNMGEYFMPGVGFDEEQEVGNSDNLDDVSDDEDNDDRLNEITESPVDLKELETILEPSDDEKIGEEEEQEEEEGVVKDKKNIPVALGGPGPGRPKRGGHKAVEGMSALNSLLEETAEKLENEALRSRAKEDEGYNDEPTRVPVSEAKLKAVLMDENEEGNDDDDAETDQEEEEDEERVWKRTQEEVLPAISYAAMVPLKIKRSNRNYQQDVVEEEEQEEASSNGGSEAREYIRRFLELEDDENTNLANALNLATMAQVQRDDKLVVPEAKFIKKAIEDEKAIQLLRAELAGDGDVDLDPSPVVAAAEAIAKREMDYEPEDLPEEEGAEEEEEPEDNQEEEEEEEVEYYPEDFPEEEDEEEENMIQEMGFGGEGPTDLAQKLREYLVHTGALQRENEVDDETEDPLQRGAWLDRPIEMGQEGITEDDWELNPLIRELYQRYTAGQLSKRVQPEMDSLEPMLEEFDPLEEEEVEKEEEEAAEEEEPSPGEIEDMEAEIERTLEGYIQARKLNELQREEALEEEEEGICPAVDLVDGCRYAVGNLGLKLDDEAMDLCNRHQLCYTCGAAHGMTVTDCDNGYLREANRLCEAEGDEDDCSTDAAGLFILMLESHRFNSDQVPDVCENPCAMDYIVGLDKK